jgi:histidyl-tRNA synthetase
MRATCVQLLKEKKLLPKFPHIVDDVVMALEDSLKIKAAEKGKKMRW